MGVIAAMGTLSVLMGTHSATVTNVRPLCYCECMMKGNEMSFSEHWATIYWAFPDNAFDYVGKPFHVEPGLIKLWDGETQSMLTYAEVPF